MMPIHPRGHSLPGPARRRRAPPRPAAGVSPSRL